MSRHHPVYRRIVQLDELLNGGLHFASTLLYKTSDAFAFVGYYLDRYRSRTHMLCAQSARSYRRLLSDGPSKISQQNNDTCGSLSHSSKGAAG